MLVTPVVLITAYILQIRGYDVWYILKYSVVWIAFYYGGMLVKNNQPKFISLKYLVCLLIAIFALEIVETIEFRQFEDSLEIAYSQMRISGFLYAAALVLIAVSQNEKLEDRKMPPLLVFLGDNSYGIFYIHYLWLMVINMALRSLNITLILPLLQVLQLFVAITFSLITVELIRVFFKGRISKLIFGV